MTWKQGNQWHLINGPWTIAKSSVLGEWRYAICHQKESSPLGVFRSANEAIAYQQSLSQAQSINAKLSDDAIRSIRKTALVREELLRKIKEEMSTEAMARKHGVNPSTINKYVGNRLRLERVE